MKSLPGGKIGLAQYTIHARATVAPHGQPSSPGDVTNPGTMGDLSQRFGGGKWPREVTMKIRRIVVVVSFFVIAGTLISCGGSQSSSPPSTPPSADCASAPYFPCQQGWLGGDGAYSIPLGNGSSLWIFADTF